MNCFRALGPLLAMALLFSGCGTLKKIIPHRQRPPRAEAVPQPTVAGQIVLVNEESHFVLIDSGDYPIPSSGTTLKSYTGTAESGELLATEMRRRPHIIADIKSGAPQKGDRVKALPSGKKEESTRVARALPVEPPPPAKRPWWKFWARRGATSGSPAL